jgi:hypothetical protein
VIEGGVDASRPPRGRGVLGRLALLCVGLGGAFLALEVLFRIAGLVVGFGRLEPLPAGDHVVVLCVGDSHTWGRGRGYPAALAALLAERSPRYRVVNLGVPGANTAQLRNRFLDYLDLYRPSLVIHWAGINNAYNRAETEVWGAVRGARTSRSRALFDQSRVLRFVRVWRNQWELQRVLAAADAYVKPESSRTVGKGNTEQHHRWLAGREEVFRSTLTEGLPHDVHVRVTELDLRWMIQRSRERGVPLVAISYGLPGGWLAAANEGIERATEATGTALVRSEQAALRIMRRYRGRRAEQPVLYDKSVHPTQALYEEIAVLVLETLDAHALLPRATYE